MPKKSQRCRRIRRNPEWILGISMVYLKVPEEKGENQSDTETHEPGNEHESCVFDVGEEA